MKRTFAATALALTISIGAAAWAKGGVLELPGDYRSWPHAKSMVISDKSNGLYGFHHVYVQPRALKTYKAGGKHAEGSMLAVTFYEVVTEAGTVTQGPLKMIALMKKDKAASETGGWRYGAFGPDGKALEIDVKTGCYDCHTAKKDRDFIFSEYQ
ncbi:MAG: cytochrome P460 family protein [Deltaproteobacteria bacterium]|nr:cytochrome P460 family protein [Deltaproteobacteria bacterium]